MDSLYCILVYKYINDIKTKVAYIATYQEDGWYYFNDNTFYRFQRINNENIFQLYAMKVWNETKELEIISIGKINVTKIENFEKMEGQYIPPEIPENPDAGIEAAVQWAENLATTRNVSYGRLIGVNPISDNLSMYDCSSMVCTAFKLAGFDTGATWTQDMDYCFSNYGFTVYPSSSFSSNDELIRGDILLNDISTYHTCIYIGDGYTADCGDSQNTGGTACHILPMQGLLYSFGVAYNKVIRWVN